MLYLLLCSRDVRGRGVFIYRVLKGAESDCTCTNDMRQGEETGENSGQAKYLTKHNVLGITQSKT